MRTVLLASSIATCIAAPVVAHADPLEVHAPASEEAPRIYVASGAVLGYANEHALAGMSVEVGTRISNYFVVHAETVAGKNAFVSAGGDLLIATAGIDVTTCKRVERVCLSGGLAAGYEHSTRIDSASGENMSVTAQGAQGAVRSGVDVGGTNVRFRFGLESTVFVGVTQAAMTGSVAFRF